MEIEYIHNERQAEYFAEGECGEIVIRMIVQKGIPSLKIIAYQAKVLTDVERRLLSGLRDHLQGILEKIHFVGSDAKKGGEE